MRTYMAKQQTTMLMLTLMVMLHSPALFADVSSQSEAVMPWPMQVGESVRDLARLFYPKNPYMQQQFIAATIKLNLEEQPDLDPRKAFDEAHIIAIPSIKALSRKGKPKSAQPLSERSSEVNIAAVPVISAQLAADYEALLNRNAVFKAELDTLNTRLAHLQQVFETVKASLIQLLETAAAAKPPVEAAAVSIEQKTVQQHQKILPIITPALAEKNRPHVQPRNGTQRVVANAPPVPAISEQTPYIKLLVPAAAIVLAIGLFVGLNLHTRRQARKIELAANRTTRPWHTEAADAAGDDSEEGDLLLEQAKIYVNLGKESKAIQLLGAHIQAAPKAALQHWLYLLDIYRATDQKEAFLQSARQLHQTFNVAIPRWEQATGTQTMAQVFEASSLEEYGYIVDKVTKMWADCAKEVRKTMQVKNYLDQLLTDNRGGERNGFSREVIEDIMLLRDTLNAREKLAHEV